MTGRRLRAPTLSSRSGRILLAQVLQPDYSPANQALLATTYHRWKSQASAIEGGHPEAAFRAHFAAEVAWVAARELRNFQNQPRHLLVVAVDEVSEVLGINTAYWVEAEQAWYLAVGTTRPVDQPGYPNPDQVRGIGLEVLGALVALMNEIVCAPVTLEPLDDAARRFWAARGFHDEGLEMRMSCPESQVLASHLAHSERDDPGAGDAPFFTEHRPGTAGGFRMASATRR